MHRNLLLYFLLFAFSSLSAQPVKLYGKIFNSKKEPLAFASIQIKEFKQGTVTRDDGTYELELDEGKYDLVVSMIGYKTQVLTVIIGKTNTERNVILSTLR